MLKKGLIAGVIILVFGLALNWLVSVLIPSLADEYQNTNIFRPWDDPLMMVYFVYPFILGSVLYYLWDKLEGKIKGVGATKALEFAKLYFIVATITGMFITFTSMQVSLLMTLVWALTGFIQAYLAALVFVKK